MFFGPTPPAPHFRRLNGEFVLLVVAPLTFMGHGVGSSHVLGVWHVAIFFLELSDGLKLSDEIGA